MNWDETNRFEQLLASGVPPPDAAVFVDGVNDWANGFVREQYGLLDASVPFTGVWSRDQHEQLLARSGSGALSEDHDLDREVRLVAGQYRAGVLRSQVLGRRYDVPVVHVWQPILSTMPARAPGNATVLDRLDADPTSARSTGRAYRQAMEAAGADLVDLTNVFDGATRPVFFDWCHTNEWGARRVAAALYPHLVETLDRS